MVRRSMKRRPRKVVERSPSKLAIVNAGKSHRVR
jgi:hypothetical protein